MTEEEVGKPLSDNIIVWETEEGQVRITQMIDDDVDVDGEIEKVKSANPTWTFKFKGRLSETGVGVNIFYDALAIDDEGMLAYDMVKARDIWRDILRRIRAPKLAQLDIEYQRADERGDLILKAEIVEKKNILRDCTNDPAIDEATSLNDLRRSLPELLVD